MNKKEIAGSIFLLAFLIIATIPYGNADIYQNSSIIINVNIVEPIAMIEVSPNNITLNETTIGYNTDPVNINFTNRGSLDITITPVLEIGANNMFNYLEFNTGTCTTGATWYNMTHYTNSSLLSISKPGTYGGEKSDNACIRLGLDNYGGSEINSEIHLSTNLTFWVMSA